MSILSVGVVTKFIGDLQDLEIIERDEYGYWFLEHYDVINYFIDNWVLDKNMSVYNYYLGENNPDEFENYDKLYTWVRDSILKRFKELVNHGLSWEKENN